MTSYEERLEIVPSNPEQAAGYRELLALWKALRVREEPDPAELVEWDQLVVKLLTIDERGYYLDEKRLAGATVAAGKVNRLAGVLLGRHNPPVGIARRASAPPPEDAPPAAEGVEDSQPPAQASAQAEDSQSAPEKAAEQAETAKSATEASEEAGDSQPSAETPEQAEGSGPPEGASKHVGDSRTS